MNIVEPFKDKVTKLDNICNSNYPNINMVNLAYENRVKNIKYIIVIFFVFVTKNEKLKHLDSQNIRNIILSFESIQVSIEPALHQHPQHSINTSLRIKI